MALERFFRFSRLAALTVCALLSCHGPKPEEIVVKIGETQITVGEVTRELNRRRDVYEPEAAQSNAQARNVKKSIVSELIDRRLLLAEATKQGLQVEPEELEIELRKYKSNYTELTFQKMLQERGFTPEEWADLKKENLLIQKFLRGQVALAPVSEDDLKKYYEGHVADYSIPESVHVRQIVTDTKDKAEAILRRLVQGENFAKLAGDLSLSPDRQKGGDLGFIHRGAFPREFEVCFSMKPGEISPIIPSLYGFHIFKILEKAPPRTQEFAEVRDKIEAELKDRAREDAVKKQIESLRAQAKVTINDKLLERIQL